MSNHEWNPSLWLDIFDELLNDDNELDYGDLWVLNFSYNQTNEVTTEERRRGWKVYSHCGFGRYKCGTCGKIWRSARVVILFRYRLRHDRGTVIMRPFGQSCRDCHGEFSLPGFDEKAVKDALYRLFSKIRKNCYNDEDDDDDTSSICSTKVYTKPHEKTLCEACQRGICCLDDDGD